jgi:hypothetical protein
MCLLEVAWQPPRNLRWKQTFAEKASRTTTPHEMNQIKLDETRTISPPHPHFAFSAAPCAPFHNQSDTFMIAEEHHRPRAE